MAISTTSYVLTPQAKDDTFTNYEDSFNSTVYLDVMSNDLGGKAKALYSIDNGDVLSDLLAKDTAPDTTENGNLIWIEGGKIAFSFQDGNVNTLSQGQVYTDTFTYAIRLGNGTLSAATVTVTIIGENDAPEAENSVGGTFNEDAVIGGDVNDHSSDIDAQDTHTFSADEVDGLTFNADGTWRFDGQSLGLAAGQTQEVSFTYTITDNNGASDTGTVCFVVVGVADPEGPVNEAETYIFNAGVGFPAEGDNTLDTNQFDENDTLLIAGFGGGKDEIDSIVLTSADFDLGDPDVDDTLITITEENTSSGKTDITEGYIADYTFTDTSQIEVTGWDGTIIV